MRRWRREATGRFPRAAGFTRTTPRRPRRQLHESTRCRPSSFPHLLTRPPAMTSAPLPATPERLTAILRRAAVLKGDEVVDVAVETARDTLISCIARLR